jgi:8-oxo-dGTP pyrophosphatase MutT (NUDIX family)
LGVQVTTSRLRQTVRALLLDEDDHVLLVHFDGPGLVTGGFWACPGGGIDPGEPPESALRRELGEELGLDDFEVRGPVWRLTRMFSMTGWDGQTDTTYLVRTPRFEPRPRVDLAAEGVHGVRWFSPTDVETGVVTFSPRDLAAQLGVVRREGVPATVREIAAL